jgi:two-component system sensor histidine kinase TctE
VALELSPLIADKDLDFEIATAPAPVRSHEWMLRELVRNLLHNAIKHTPVGGALAVRVETGDSIATLTLADSGPGIGAELRTRLFQPFSAGNARNGSGLGLAICQEIVRALGGTISLDNREQGARVEGLDTTVRLPLAENTA